MLHHKNKTVAALAWAGDAKLARRGKTVLGLSAALGLSSDQIDELFIAAEALEVWLIENVVARMWRFGHSSKYAYSHKGRSVIRNDQVNGSSPLAGSSFPRVCVVLVTLSERENLTG